jgi:hypothetical protein
VANDLIDETGKIVIEPEFDNWTNFSEGLAAVSVDFKWGYIDKSGKWAIPPQFAVRGLTSVRVDIPNTGQRFRMGARSSTQLSINSRDAALAQLGCLAV